MKRTFSITDGSKTLLKITLSGKPSVLNPILLELCDKVFCYNSPVSKELKTVKIKTSETKKVTSELPNPTGKEI